MRTSLAAKGMKWRAGCRRSAMRGALFFSFMALGCFLSLSVFDSVCTIFALWRFCVAFGLSHPLCCCSSDTRTTAAPLAGQINAARDRELNKERAHLCYFWPPQSKYYCSAHRHNCRHFCERKHGGVRRARLCYPRACLSRHLFKRTYAAIIAQVWVRKNNRQKLVLFHSAVEISANKSADGVRKLTQFPLVCQIYPLRLYGAH